MAALNQFYDQSYTWYLRGRTRPCDPARIAVYQRQRDRFGGPLTLRHVPQTSAVLTRADLRAREDADRERRRLVLRACENERLSQKAA